VLVNECTGWTEVGSLFLKAERRKGGAGRLLSQSRYMLIGAEPELFNENVLAELRGVFTPDGACPFWDHVATNSSPGVRRGRPHDRLDGQAVHPRPGPAPPDLHRPAARARPRRDRQGPPQGVPAMALLESEGFRPNGLIDIFDAGPTVSCAARQHPHRPRRPPADGRRRRRGRGRTARPDLDRASAPSAPSASAPISRATSPP
jgi:arginine N-succinyltransferase